MRLVRRQSFFDSAKSIIQLEKIADWRFSGHILAARGARFRVMRSDLGVAEICITN
jgi:hypothetical protein